MKNILFPTDFSPAANHAFIYALEVADELDASITTLHVYQLPDIKGVQLPHTLQEVYDSISIEEFKNYQDSIPLLHQIAEDRNLTHIPMNHIMQEGETVSTILRTIKKDQVDLVVMGTKGASGLKEIFVGSVAGEVLENAECPVLAVPEEAVFDGIIDRIAITTHFTPEEKKTLKKVIEFARYFEADIFCINVDTPNTAEYNRRMEDLRREFEHLPHVKFEVLKGSDMLKTVSKYVEKNNIDVLAMLSHRRNFFQELFNYSSVKQLSYHTSTPILSIQAHTLS